jgi:hypothetical protein
MLESQTYKNLQYIANKNKVKWEMRYIEFKLRSCASLMGFLWEVWELKPLFVNRKTINNE